MCLIIDIIVVYNSKLYKQAAEFAATQISVWY